MTLQLEDTLTSHLARKGINLPGLTVTLTSGEASWASTKHSGFVRRMEALSGGYLLQLDALLADTPPWVLAAPDFTLAIHIPEELKTWAHHFKITHRHVKSGYLFLRARTTCGEPVWS